MARHLTPRRRFRTAQALLKAGNTNAAARELSAASEELIGQLSPGELLAKVDTLRSALSKQQQSARNRWMLIAIFAGTALTFLVLMSVSRSSTVAASLQVRGVRFTTANEVTVGALDTRWIPLEPYDLGPCPADSGLRLFPLLSYPPPTP